MRNLIYAVVLMCGLPSVAPAQERYLLLAATRTGTMQAEVNDAAARGYRVVAASCTEGAEVIVTLERAEGRYQYLLIATTRTGTLQKELTDGVEAGYRAIPRAVTTKRTASNSWLANQNNRDEGEVLVIM